MGFSSFVYNTFMKTNVRYALFIVAGAAIFEPIFNKTTSHYFKNVINRGRGFEYFEKELMLRANQEEDEE